VIITAAPTPDPYEPGLFDVKLFIMVLFVALVVLIIALISWLDNGNSKQTAGI